MVVKYQNITEYKEGPFSYEDLRLALLSSPNLGIIGNRECNGNLSLSDS